MVNHDPIKDVDIVCSLYSKKDGVPITYVCTTSLPHTKSPCDIFFRETPHPEFGNRYFGLYQGYSNLFITNADNVEELTFDTIRGDAGYEYSRHRHDFCSVPGAGFIDGGRDYTRVGGDPIPEVVQFKVKDGKFCPVSQ